MSTRLHLLIGYGTHLPFYAETGEPTGVWGVDTGGHKEPCIRCGPDFRREGAFWEGRPRRDAVFRQYSLTTRYR